MSTKHMANSWKVEPIYTSCACNISPHCLDWGRNDLIAYAACNAIALYKPEDGGSGRVVATLTKHQKLVTSISWIKKAKFPEFELLSTSADKTAIVWTLISGEYHPANVLSGHSNVVRVGSAVYSDETNDQLLLIATGSADSTVKIWSRDGEKVECFQTLSLGNGLAIDLKLARLDDSVHVLAISRDDSKIHVYVEDSTEEFKFGFKLCGHEDWIQSLDFVKDENGTLLLASGSQDNFIRIWQVTSKISETAENKKETLKLEEQYFCTHSGQEYSVSLLTVLRGHDNRVFSVRWSYYDSEGSEPLQLLSASMDKSMVIWQYDQDMEIWLDVVRVGDIGGDGLGLYGAVFNSDGTAIIGHNYQGATYLWKLTENIGRWKHKVAFSGHFGSVQDIAWDREGLYLLSCSHDQTTRLHAPLAKHDGKIWQELARPQVHGYDMVCLAAVDRYRFVSGADEKVIRCFNAPKSFAETLRNLCDVDTSEYMLQSLPEGASVPPLGLSNKAVFESDIMDQMEKQQQHGRDRYPDFYYSPVVLSEPPTETLLLQNTLWPEDKKLYGHPYEVFAVAVNHSRTLVASACKASKAEHAAIMFWNVGTWKRLGTVEFHTLTITQLEFSPNDQYLLSVSRDRLWAVYESFPNEDVPYKKVANSDKKNGVHSRIIWSCAWSHDSFHFTTASRDKMVAVWLKSCDKEKTNFVVASKPLEVESSATAVAFGPCLTEDQRYLIAIGMENGKILIYTWQNAAMSDDIWRKIYVLQENCAHHLAVNRLRFCPLTCEQKKNGPGTMKNAMKLASCGSDNFVRIYNIQMCHSS